MVYHIAKSLLSKSLHEKIPALPVLKLSMKVLQPWSYVYCARPVTHCGFAYLYVAVVKDLVCIFHMFLTLLHFDFLAQWYPSSFILFTQHESL